MYTDKKEKYNFLYKEIQMGSGAKSKVIYEEGPPKI
jgi:hypothetical protein